MKKRVLVFPCGSEIGLEIHRSLQYSTHFELVGGSSVDDHGKFVYRNYVGDLPNVDEDDFIEKINTLIHKEKIDFIIPAHDSVVLRLAQAGEIACTVLTSPVETCEVARSKSKTYQLFEGKLPVPKMYSAAEVQESDLPIFLKPDVGQGSKGTLLAKTMEELNFFMERDASLLALEYLPGDEYTIDCFTDRHGELRFCSGRVRRRIQNGISVNSQSIKRDDFEKFAKIISSTMKFRGAWFYQLKEAKNGELTLLEIAPRIAGTSGLARIQGANLTLMSIFDAMDTDIELIINETDATIDRALANTYKQNLDYGHVYLDFDDVVVQEGQLNPLISAFISQCLNKGIKLHLLTRHKDDLGVTLKNHRLDGLFDEIVWLKNGEPKSDHIKEKDAIFIDDSFAERQAVSREKHIPVFDTHMVEGLMEAL